MILEIQVQAWTGINIVTGLNRLVGSQFSFY